MSNGSAPDVTAGHVWRRPMGARSSTEEHRVATPLELLFDLCFVVAVALAAARLHHALAEAHVGQGILGYVLVFFAIWWAWMNFTWFASAYDCDDALYRLATLVQIAGALIMAAGIPRAFDAQDFTVIILGYVVMRLALVAQWLRAARSDVDRRHTALRYAAGICLVQVGWVGLLAVPAGWRPAAFAVLAAAELTVPIWAERTGATTWHPHHIAERYGLFTIIVLGESVLAATVAVQEALDTRQATANLFGVAAGGLLIVFSMWWLYFAKPADRLLSATSWTSFLWGYGHLLIFASAAAVGAGLAVAVDQVTGQAHLPVWGAAVTVPVAVYLLALWALHARPHLHGWMQSAVLPLGALLVLAATVTSQPVLITGLVLTGLVIAFVLIAHRAAHAGRAAMPASSPQDGSHGQGDDVRRTGATQSAGGPGRTER